MRRGAEVLAQKQVQAAEAETAAVGFDLAAIERAAPPPAPPTAALVAPLSNQRVIGYAVIGVGAATIAAAGVLEIVALVNRSAANAPDACFNNFCTQAGFDAVGRARTFANAGQWVGIGGIVVAAVGVTLAATAPRPAPAPRPARRRRSRLARPRRRRDSGEASSEGPLHGEAAVHDPRPNPGPLRSLAWRALVVCSRRRCWSPVAPWRSACRTTPRLAVPTPMRMLPRDRG